MKLRQVIKATNAVKSTKSVSKLLSILILCTLVIGIIPNFDVSAGNNQTDTYLPLYSSNFEKQSNKNVPYTTEMFNESIKASNGQATAEVLWTTNNLKTTDFDGTNDPTSVLTNNCNNMDPGAILFKFTTTIPGGFKALDLRYAGRAIDGSGTSPTPSYVKFTVSDNVDVFPAMPNISKSSDVKHDPFDNGACNTISDGVLGKSTVYLKVELSSINFSWGCLKNLDIIGVFNASVFDAPVSDMIFHEDFQSLTKGAITQENLANTPAITDNVTVYAAGGELKADVFESGQPDWRNKDMTLLTNPGKIGFVTYKLSTARPGGFKGLSLSLLGRGIMDGYVKVSVGSDPNSLKTLMAWDVTSNLQSHERYDTVNVLADGSYDYYVSIKIMSPNFTWACLQDIIITGYFDNQLPSSDANKPIYAEGLTPYNVMSYTLFDEQFDEFYYPTVNPDKQHDNRKFSTNTISSLKYGSLMSDYSGTISVIPIDQNYKDVVGICAVDGANNGNIVTFTIKLVSKNPLGFQNVGLTTSGRSIMSGDGALKFEIGFTKDTMLGTAYSYVENANHIVKTDGKISNVDLTPMIKGKKEAYLKVSMKEAGYPGWVFLDGLNVTELVDDDVATDKTASYNYSPEVAQWANATTKNGSMYVWIPRYTYKIDEVNKKISIKYSKGLQDDLLNGYKLHPSFTFNGKQLSGYWAAKYEASMVAGTLTGSNNDATGDTDRKWETYVNYDVEPVKSDWISSYQNASLDIKTNQVLGQDTHSHLMRNSEWEGVAYLSHSLGIIPKNYPENTALTPTAVYVKGVGQSTTGNASGVYGMSGGTTEFVAGYVYDGAASENSGLSLLKNSNIIDTYTIANFSPALTKKWNTGTYDEPLSTNGPFIVRGAGSTSLGDGIPQGIFASQMANGSLLGVGYRPVITVEPRTEIGNIKFSTVNKFPADGNIKASVFVADFDGIVPKTFSVGIYEKGTNKLIDVGTARPESIVLGETKEYIVQLQNLPTVNTDNYYVKAYLWNNLDGITPVIDAAILPNVK